MAISRMSFTPYEKVTSCPKRLWQISIQRCTKPIYNKNPQSVNFGLSKIVLQIVTSADLKYMYVANGAKQGTS